jgi:uncharacterized membrane protein YhaH (DUF805 family)
LIGRLGRDLFAFSGTLDRRRYVTIALVGVLLKHILDDLLAASFHRAWTPLNYLVPLGVPVRITALSASDRAYLLEMLLLALPFAWVGLAITAKRFRTIGWPPWLIILFFVPIANIASFAVAAAWPDGVSVAAPPSRFARYAPQDPLGAAIAALVLTVPIGLALIAVGTQLLEGYGWGLFAAIPFVQGALSAIVFGARQRRTLGQSVSVALLSVGVTVAALVALAIEGVVCVLLAAPLAGAFAVIGALFGHAVTRRLPNGAVLLALLLVAPGVMGAEAVAGRDVPASIVRTEVVVDAPPARVWDAVLRFSDLPPPTEPLFLAGIAYPIRAHIRGSGVGAVRYCEFSTGAFVEPITAWRPGRRLAFDVTHNPAPMREWSPYPSLTPPHLHGYMTSRHGEFVLEPLPGGRTRLIGTTWYDDRLWPGAYWLPISDAIVHRIHRRVLEHIKAVAERPPAV